MILTTNYSIVSEFDSFFVVNKCSDFVDYGDTIVKTPIKNMFFLFIENENFHWIALIALYLYRFILSFNICHDIYIYFTCFISWNLNNYYQNWLNITRWTGGILCLISFVCVCKMFLLFIWNLNLIKFECELNAF